MVRLGRKVLGAWAIAGATGTLLVTLACNSVLGIDSATLDPSFGTDASAAGDAGVDALANASPACRSYCSAVVQNCPSLEYNDVPTCLALCPAFDPGQPSDTSQDSLGCRTHYAQLAAGDSSKCPAAGPLGGGVCGNDLCTTFCTLDTFACVGANAAFDGGELGCESACVANFDVYRTDAGGDLALSTGNTLNCRIWHLQAGVNPADPAALAMHCPHTAVQSAYCHP